MGGDGSIYDRDPGEGVPGSTSLQTRQVAYIKYLQLFVRKLCKVKMAKNEEKVTERAGTVEDESASLIAMRRFEEERAGAWEGEQVW